MLPKNLDYAASAIMAAQQLEPPAQGHESMRYVVGDLLDWQALMHQIQAELSPPSPAPGDASEEKEGSMEAVTDPPRTGPPFLFDIVLDKSTSDAIATGPDVVFGEAEEMEEMLRMLQRGTSSSSSLEKDRKDEASDSSTGSTAAAATAEPCCPLFPPEWYALHMPGSDSSFQQYLDYLVLHSQSDPNSSLHSISLSSTPASNSNANSRTASNNALSNMSPSDKKLPPHLPLPGSASSRYDCARPAVAHSDMGEREVSSSAISSESAESAPKSHPVASGTQPSLGSGSGSGSGLGSGSGSGSGPGSGSGSGLGSGESGRSGNSNANSNTNNSSTSLGSSKAVHRVDPLVVLATHLAALVRPGGVWLIMSYSADRCAFLERPLHSPHHTPFARRHPRAPPSGGAQAHGAAPAPPAALRHPSDFWTLEDTQAIPITSESGSAPPIFHHRYVLRRTV